MPNCNKCGLEIKWPQPYVQGQKPLNAAGNAPHDCKGVPATPQPEKPPTIVGYTVLTPESVRGECTAFVNLFEGKSDVQFDALARIYISRMMSNRK